jgi:hypothetical protein
MRATGASTKYPNSRETDAQRFVLCVVDISDGAKREVMATDPLDAINKVNNQERKHEKR